MSRLPIAGELPANIEYVVGVDGGGSKTRARVIHVDGSLVGEGRAGASGLIAGVDNGWLSVQQAIMRAIQSSSDQNGLRVPLDRFAVGIGVAGANNDNWRNNLIASNPGFGALIVESDVLTALLGAHQSCPGSLVISGTGSIGQALHVDGNLITVGGWGFPSGDEGSGAAMGLKAINMTQHAADARRAHTPLTLAVMESVASTGSSLLDWCCRAGQFEFASLAPIVFEFEHDDELAAQILAETVVSVESLIDGADPTQQLPLVMYGSIGERLKDRFSPGIQERIVDPFGDAMDGAIALFSLRGNKL